MRFSPKAKRAIIYIRGADAVEVALPQAMYAKAAPMDRAGRAGQVGREGQQAGHSEQAGRAGRAGQAGQKSGQAGHSEQAEQAGQPRQGAGNELAAFIDRLLLKHRDWIIRQLGKHASTRQPAGAQQNTVPEYLEIGATLERIAIHWNNRAARNAYCLLEAEGPARLMLSTKGPEDAGAALKLLRIWVKDYALRVFEPQLGKIAAENGFEVRAVKTRLQRTRLGSCTRRGVISLNAAMLFFPPELVRHLMLHELCHLKEMNHGPGFWKLLLSLDPQGLKHDKALKKAMRSVPGWLFMPGCGNKD